MRVAVATDNGRSLAPHAGRARSFHIYDVDEDMKVIKQEERPNPHRDFVVERHRAGLTRMGHGRGLHDTPGHGGGHDILFQAIHDCDVLLARGMGPRLADDLAARGIKPVVTSETDIARALDFLIRGDLKEGGFCPEKG